MTALFGFGKKSEEEIWREEEREEQYQNQQAVLARRRTNSWQKVRRGLPLPLPGRRRCQAPRAHRQQAHVLPLSLPHPALVCFWPPPFEPPFDRGPCCCCLLLQDVVDRRKEVSKYLQNPEYRKQVDAEKRARFKAKKEQAVSSCSRLVSLPACPPGCCMLAVGLVSQCSLQPPPAPGRIPSLARPPVLLRPLLPCDSHVFAGAREPRAQQRLPHHRPPGTLRKPRL